ncbi:MAG: xanthan lyase [Bacteroidales bacterium]|nr:xanthan lyase [Bacteroidales bacterium]
MTRRLPILLLFLLAAIPATGQNVPRSRDFRTLCDTLSARLERRTTVHQRISVTRVTKNGSALDLTFNADLSYYPWHNSDVEWFKKQLQQEWTFEGFTPGKIMTNRYELEELATPVVGSDGKPGRYAFSSADPRQSRSRFIEREGARHFPKGMSDRYIALWQSHGRYYDEAQDLWTWQRACIHRTVEDMFTQTFVLPFLIPMLENAGAYVMTPRERDTQWREFIIDNDRSFEGPRADRMRRSGHYHEEGRWETAGTGFADTKPQYTFSDNPFQNGTARQAGCSGDEANAVIRWTPRIEDRGRYAVYISYKSLPTSTRQAHYTVRHMGGQTEFTVNQRRGGGTWIYLGSFEFAEGNEGGVTLDNRGPEGSVVTADAVKIGGGMGKLERGGRTSGVAASVEGAHYWMQWAGVDTTITRGWETDYTNDYASRGAWTVMMREQKNIPIDLAFAFHTDAGVTPNDSTVGTLAIYTLREDGKREFSDGRDRILSRTLCDYVQSQVVQDLRLDFDPKWSRRGLWDRSYSEPRTAGVPAMILELLSHQNFADMKYGLDPAFRFTTCRAVYKGLLKALSEFYHCSYVVQPLPPQSFAARLHGTDSVRLSWRPTDDPKEPTATSRGYTVYTRLDDGAFDQGVETTDTSLTLPIRHGHSYSFKVEAWNDGGRSFPSEILAVGIPNGSKRAPVLIVNNFDRISAPAWVESPGFAGFESRLDSGVPYLSDIGYIGENYEFRRSALYVDNEYPGFGASYDDHAGETVAGNSFDYPFRHGQAMMRLGYPFYSMSREAFCASDEPVFALDLICGKQGRTPTGRGAMPDRFPVFPEALVRSLRKVIETGGNLIVSGANIASDQPKGSEAAVFTEEVLGYSLANPFGTNSGCIADMPFSTDLNAEIYCVERPDGLKPAGQGAKTWLRYPGSLYAAAVFKEGENYRAVSIGVPVETVLRAADRQWILSEALGYLYDGKKPASKKR